jgi:Tfp pilus assembly protein PilF
VHGCQDFIVDLESAGDAAYRVRILESPAGNASGSFVPPLAGGEVRGFFDELIRRRGSSPLRDLVAFTDRSRPTARSVGRKLFEALFQGGVRDRYVASWHRVRETGEGLRIKLRLDPDDPDAARLHSLPWEFLYQPDARRFLARSRHSPVVRYLDVPQPAELPPVPLPLRVIVVMANPAGTPPLDLDRERKAMTAVWRRHPAVEMTFLPEEPGSRATPQALRRALLERECHVLHFMGHGGFDRKSGEGTLFFETGNGAADPVSGEELAELLQDFESLRLVVVNACHSAEATDEAGRNPFTGVATALVRHGIPAVVAMQTAISDRAAIAFSRELYHRLAAGDPIDLAVVEGRRAIGRPGRSDEWGTPVLFLRARECRLFAEPAGDRAEVERPPSWSWSPVGTAYLAAGVAGLALLAGLGWLLLAGEPALRSALTVIGSLTAAIVGLSTQHDPIPGRLLSHWIARHRPLGWGLVLIFLLGLAAWGRTGREALCYGECGPLCSPPGIQRVMVRPFESLIPGGGAGPAWAAETTDALVGALGLVEGIWPLPGSGIGDEETRRCVDFVVDGDLRASGEEIVLTAAIVRRGGRSLAAVEVRGIPDEASGSLTWLENRLALEILEALGFDPDPKILAFPTADPEALKLNREGVESFLRDELFAAEAKLEAALERDPGYADAANNLGMVKLRQRQFEPAIDRFQDAVSLLPRYPSYHFNLGLAFADSGRPHDAVAAYEDAVRLDPTHSRAWNNLGFVLLELGDLDQAQESLKHGLANTRDGSVEARLYKNLGRVALDRGAPAEAVAHLEKAIERFDPYPEALFYRAVALEALGRGACDAWRAYATSAEADAAERRQQGRKRLETCPQER